MHRQFGLRWMRWTAAEQVDQLCETQKKVVKRDKDAEKIKECLRDHHLRGPDGGNFARRDYVLVQLGQRVSHYLVQIDRGHFCGRIAHFARVRCRNLRARRW